MKTLNTVYLKDYTPPDYFVDQVNLTFNIRQKTVEVISSLQVRKNHVIPYKNPSLVFDKGDYEIISVIANGMVLLPGEYESDKNSFSLANTPNAFELEIKTLLKPHENTSLEGLYVSGETLCTQCEAEGFRKITPFLDRPDVMSRYSCTIIADKEEFPVLLSNGNLINSGELEGNRHYVQWDDPFKKPCYLFALVAGKLEHIHNQFTTRSGRRVELKIYSEKENINKCQHAMKSLIQAMEWDEKRFGLEYDLDLYQIVAINDFNAGAMENKGLNIFNSKYVLANPKTATDEDFMNVQGVIAHEYFHNWTGNRVTLKNWFQLSLKEGLTVFRDQEFSSDLNSRGVKRIGDVRNIRGSQFPEDAGPMSHPVRPESYIKMDNFYTMTVYEKGAELVRMLHQLTGEKKFQKGMKLYFQKFDGMAVTIEDFIAVMEEASGICLEQFKLWYSQSGTPIVTMKRSYNEGLSELCLTFEQFTAPDRNQKDKKPLHIPIHFSIIDPASRNITMPQSRLLELRKAKESFVFKNIPKNSIPSVFRQFSAPVKIQTDLNGKELAFLMANDTDEFIRWDAAQTLFIKEFKKIVELVQRDEPLKVSGNLISAFRNALIQPDADRAFMAKVLTLPSEMEIKDHFELVDVDAIHKARKFLKSKIAGQLEQEFYETVHICSASDPLNLSHLAIADRSLKNLSLGYLGSLKKEDTSDMIWNHFQSAENMTDELAAFRILANIDEDNKRKAATDFYAKWKNDKLVLDKWFMIQATSTLPDTLKQINGLIEHPDFSIKNPNKVRSLFFMFAMQNPFRFHASNGQGYAFVADHIIQLDSINHNLAARLSGCFNHWKKYDDHRRAIMKKELERIIAVPALSKNVYEIVSRALE